MKLTAAYEKPQRLQVDVLALPLFVDGPAAGMVDSVDRLLGGLIKDMRSGGEFKGRDTDESILPAGKKLQAKRVLLVGLGERNAFDAASVMRYAGAAVRAAAKRGFGSIGIVLPEGDVADRDVGEAAASGAIMAVFDPAPYRTKRDNKPDSLKNVSLLASRPEAIDELSAGVERGIIFGEAANAARQMVNTPSNEMTPSHLASRASEFAKKLGLKVTVLDRPELERLGMGSFLSVAAGSDEPPKMIVLEYAGDKKSKTILGLIGKGVTFDTGGISLKPAQDMDAMKGDMAGGATVIAAMAAIARLKPKANVIGIVGATENMPSGKATKPGDIVKALNGKSIEVINTDAEGRMVLADALGYARKLKATHLVDIATLTGAVVVALGNTTTGVMSNDRELVDLFHEASAASGERYWELPLFPEYSELIRSPIADMKNSGGRPAGSIYGAMFLKEFVDDTPWIHLDIAGTSWTDREGGHLTKGPTGVALRPLVRLAELLAERPVHYKADEAAHKRLVGGFRPRQESGRSNGSPVSKAKART
ncbi:MAG: leucyl aminopeptidase [Candidatus Eremiobacteraeota bacterium]|nr:leucyl aminopeptidase [Candidatus Eremiobacteraeota bacterium]